MCLATTNDSVVTPFHPANYAPDQLSSHFSIKSTTSSIIPGNLLVVIHNSSDLGTSSSLASWPARICIPFASSCIAS